MFWFIFFFFLQPCFSEESPFFKEIGQKPKGFQKKALEHRIQFIFKREIDMETKLSVKTYLELGYGDDEEKIDFIGSFLINKEDEEKKKYNIKRKILSSAIQSCKRSQCIFLLELLTKIKDIRRILNKRIRTEIITQKLLRFQNYSPSFVQSSFITKLFDKLISDNKKNLKKILSFSNQYGMYEYVGGKITEYKKEFGNKGWFKYKECFLFIVRNQYQKAKDCSEHSQDGWLRFLYLYSTYLQGGEVTNKEIKELGSLLGEGERHWFVVFQILFSKKATKEMFSDIDMNKIMMMYTLGHYFFAINSRYHIFEGEELEKLKKTYSEQFKGSLFEQVLNGQVDREKLAEYFGKNSLAYRFYKDPL